MEALTGASGRRKVGVGDEPNNANANDTLGEHWKSALCVTSLYDSYVAVQHENDGLKDQLRQLQHANELLQATNGANNATKKRCKRRTEPNETNTANTSNDTNDSDDDDRDHHFVQEIRLLRAEKAQQELLFDKRRVQLEALADQYKARALDAEAKYQQKFELDPLAPQRVALSTRALQHALDTAVREKEALVVEHARLQQRLHDVDTAYRVAQATLRDQHEQLDARRKAQATHRVRAVLETWALGRLTRAWHHWTLVALRERVRAEQVEVTRQQKQLQDDATRRATQARATAFVARWLADTTLRRFLAWHDYAQRRQRTRARVAAMRDTIRRRQLGRVVAAWQANVRVSTALAHGTTRAELVLTRHALRQAWHTWQCGVVRTHTAQQQRTIKALETDVATLQDTIHELTQRLETVTQECQQQTQRDTETAQAHAAHVQVLVQQSEHARERVSDVLWRRAQRLTLSGCFRAWRETTMTRHLLRRKTELLTRQRYARAVTNAVTHWHDVAHKQRRFTQLTWQAVQRLRLLGAYRCFSAWREFATVRRARIATLARVVSHMQSQHVAKSFATWQRFGTERRSARQRLTVLCTLTTRCQLAGAFRAWQQRATALSAEAEQLRRQQIEREWRERLEQSKRELQVLRGHFQRWHRAARSDKRVRQLTSKYVVKWRHGTQAQCMAAWQAFVARRRVARDIVRRLLTRRSTRDLQVAWSTWRTHALVVAKQQALAAVEEERDARVEALRHELSALRLAHDTAKARDAEQEQQRVRERLALDTALTAAQRQCRQYETALLRAGRTRSETRARRQCLHAWQQVVRTARRRERLVRDALETKRVALTRRVFRQWTMLTRRRQSVVLAATRMARLWHCHAMAACYNAWHAYATQARCVRDATRTFETATRHRLCRGVLVAWHDDARKTRLLRTTLEQIWLSSVHAHMSECFKRWHEGTLAMRLQDAARHRQLALDAVRARVCARWTTRSLQTVLSAWRRGVDHQKRARAGVQRLQRLNTLRVVASAFEAWQACHAQCHAQRTWLLGWHTRQQRAAVHDAWRQWKETTVRRRVDAMAALETACRDHERALTAKESEMAALLARHATLTTQLETLERACGDADHAAATLAQRVVLTKSFCHWHFAAQARRQRETRLDRCRQRSHQRRQQRAFCAWATAVDAQHERQRRVDERYSHSTRQQLRAVLISWHGVTQRQLLTKRVLHRLGFRRGRDTQRFVFHTWRAFVARSRGTKQLVAALEAASWTVARHRAFQTWQQAAQRQRAVAAQQVEKQRRVLAFMTGKHTLSLATCFAAWHTLAVARHARLAAATHLLTRRRQRCLRELWHAWRDYQQWQRSSTRGVASLVRLVARQHVRVALHHWRTHATQCHVSSLALERQQLEAQRQRLQHSLDETQGQVTQLRDTVASLEETHVMTQRTLAANVSACAAQTLDTQRQRVLTKLLVKSHTVPRSERAIGAAFERWHRHAARASRQLAALRRCCGLLTRQQQAHAFGMWRRRVVAYARLADVTQRRAMHSCRLVLRAWTHFVRDRATQRRRFLVRWIDVTHTQHVRAQLERHTALAFRVWQLYGTVTAATTALRVHTQASAAQSAATRRQQQQQTLLTKWCWRAYHTRCQALRRAMRQWHAMAQVPHERTHVLAARTKATTRTSERATGVVGEVETVMARVALSLQTLFRRLAAAPSCAELFDAVVSSIAQLSGGSAAGVLYLLDPTSNELWTQQRDVPQPTVVPATLGLAGRALASRSTLIVENVVQDTRFHPLVDHAAVAGVTGVTGVTAVANTDSNGHGVDVALFTTAIIGVDGVALGVMQIAFRHDDDSGHGHGHGLGDTIAQQQIHTRLLGHACGFFVEQLVYEMVRHSRDRARARTPSSFAKLFKQTKHWRKYFVQVEKEAQKTQQQLQQLLAEQDLLLAERQRLYDAVTQLEREQRAVAQERKTTTQQREHHEQLRQYVLAYKKKMTKLKALAQQTETLLADKTQALQRAEHDHMAFKQDVQAREWQAMLHAAVTTAASSSSPRKRHAAKLPEPDRALLLEDADVAALKNQLVRAESDSLLLVKAVDVATRHGGTLPEPLKVEVDRIARRLKT